MKNKMGIFVALILSMLFIASATIFAQPGLETERAGDDEEKKAIISVEVPVSDEAHVEDKIKNDEEPSEKGNKADRDEEGEMNKTPVEHSTPNEALTNEDTKNNEEISEQSDKSAKGGQKDMNITPVERPVPYNVLTMEDIKDNDELIKWYKGNNKSRGIKFKSLGSATYVLIGSGEKPTGGYSIRIGSVTMVSPGRVYITAKDIAPSPDMMVTQALTYPHILIKLDEKEVTEVEGEWEQEYNSFNIEKGAYK